MDVKISSGNSNKWKVGSLYKGLVLDMPLNSESEKVGSQLVDPAASIFTSGTYAWQTVGTNTKANVGNTLQVTYVDHSYGFAWSLRDSYDLISDLTVGKRYQLILDASLNTGTCNFAWNSAPDNIVWRNASGAVLSTTSEKYIVNFTATSATAHALRLSGFGAGQVITIDNVYLRELQTADTTPYANHGVVYGATIGSDSTNFPSDNKYISLGTGMPELNPRQHGWTGSFWIKSNAPLEYIRAVDRYDPGNDYWILRLASSTNEYPSLQIYDGVTGVLGVSGTQNIRDNVWHLLTYIYDYDNSQSLIYIDGELDNTTDWSGTTPLDINPATNMVIGESNLFNESVKGYMKGLKIWNRALSATEVKSLYDLGR